MKEFFKKAAYGIALMAFTAISIPNPAPGLFTDKFGTDFRTIITSILKLALGFAGLIAVAYVIIGGYQLATARGNDDAVKSGRKTLTNAIIGLLIIILAFVIVSIVVNAAFGQVD